MSWEKSARRALSSFGQGLTVLAKFVLNGHNRVSAPLTAWGKILAHAASVHGLTCD